MQIYDSWRFTTLKLKIIKISVWSNLYVKLKMNKNDLTSTQSEINSCLRFKYNEFSSTMHHSTGDKKTATQVAFKFCLI